MNLIVKHEDTTMVITPIVGGEMNAYLLAKLLLESKHPYINPAYSNNYQNLAEGPGTFDVIAQKFGLDSVNQTIFVEGTPLFYYSHSSDPIERAYHDRHYYDIDGYVSALGKLVESGFLDFIAGKEKSGDSPTVTVGPVEANSFLSPAIADAFTEFCDEGGRETLVESVTLDRALSMVSMAKYSVEGHGEYGIKVPRCMSVTGKAEYSPVICTVVDNELLRKLTIREERAVILNSKNLLRPEKKGPAGE